jgi:hypothetical protein
MATLTASPRQTQAPITSSRPTVTARPAAAPSRPGFWATLLRALATAHA